MINTYWHVDREIKASHHFSMGYLSFARRKINLTFFSISFFLYGAATTAQTKSELGLSFSDLEMRARGIITYHCGACHTPGLSTSHAKALKIFDLSDDDRWWTKMNVSQLKRSKQMLEGRTTLTKEELAENFRGWKSAARAPTADELKVYSDFLEKSMNKTFDPLPK